MAKRIDEMNFWPRAEVDKTAWVECAEALGRGEGELFALFAETDRVHMALRGAGDEATRIVSVKVEEGRYPSVGAHHAPAIRLERAIRDLFGHEPQGLPDERPWLDHGKWTITMPLAEKRRLAREVHDAGYAFLPAEGEGLHEIPVGPVHAGIIEPGHFRFTANGETVVRLETRLGYVHKGIERLIAGAPLDHAAKLVERLSGDSTLAYAYAFARAAETALGVSVPARAVYLRALMAELERIANHLGDFGAICNDASFVALHAHCGILREEVLQAADLAFGHRLMRDCIVPGGLAVNLKKEGEARLRALAATISGRLPELVSIYDDTPSLQDRMVTTGIVTAELARRFAPGGYVGRASGRAFDARRDLGYPPYDELQFEVPLRKEGDVNARVWIRIREVEQSLALIDQILGKLPAGATLTAVKSNGAACEGLGLTEAFRGDVLVWLRLDADARVARCHLRDASWFQLPLLETAVEGNIVADFPLCNKSFNCSYAGHDL
jgi:Ni,Fe-hydrogenase III large subunit/Ni,Fe-hydrogenase III component G